MSENPYQTTETPIPETQSPRSFDIVWLMSAFVVFAAAVGFFVGGFYIIGWSLVVTSLIPAFLFVRGVLLVVADYSPESIAARSYWAVHGGLLMALWICLLWGVLVKIIPEFEKFFIEFDFELPPITVSVMSLSRIAVMDWYIPSLCLIVGPLFQTSIFFANQLAGKIAFACATIVTWFIAQFIVLGLLLAGLQLFIQSLG